MTAPETTLQGKDRATTGTLYMSVELSDKHWKLTLSDGSRSPSRCSIAAGDTAALLERVRKAKLRCAMPAGATVHACYEAGRDGWWLHRWLRGQGIDNIVVDSASIEVNRRARRAKSDRLDGDKLLAMLLRYHAGETRVWSVLREPTSEQEDARRVHRELGRLTQERTAHTNRVGSLLVLHNLRAQHVGGRDWPRWWDSHAAQVPAALRAEIERECARLALVKQQLRALQAAQCQQVAQGAQPQVAQLSKLRSIGLSSAWVLVKELFGWRRFANRRELAACLGLAPTPYSSGDSQLERGINKAGNKRARRLLVELAWSWLRYQPDSALSQWFNRRFATAGKRMRRVGIVALARRLAVALWRYLEHGEIPPGAALKPAV
ncbi:MAG TPA: IS110 family transposase [Roseiflexaceae bacterium]|nr:IS110 family transposase [Roseiflexaceae bacterium]